MATNKKSFVIYCDMRDVFDQLPNEKAGELIKHIFSYVNDEDPKSDDVLLNVAFAPIKAQLKRDLKKWENQRQQRVDAGRASAKARRKSNNDNERSLTTVNEAERNPTANVNVNDNVNDNVIEYPYRGEGFLNKWKDWKAHRRAFDKFKYTPQSEKAALTKLQKLAKSEARAIAIIDQSIEKSWKGFFPLKQEDEPKTHVMPSPQDVLKVFPGVLKSFSAD